MAIKFNSKDQKMFLGDRYVIRVYQGDKIVYEMDPWSRYVQVSSSDFDGSGNYIGTEEYIILPEDKTSGYRITNPNVKGVATSGDYLTDTSSMFNGHTGLSLKVGYLDTSNVTSMYAMFNGSQATTLDLSSFDTSNVTNMNYMFRDSQATSLDLSNFDTSNVTNMDYMFQNSQATTLDLSSFDTSKVFSMADVFRNSQATTLDLSSFDTSNITSMSNMFNGSQATTLDLSSFDTSNVTNMNYMFNGSQATTLDLSNFDTSKVYSMADMFRNSQATTLDLSSFDTSNLTNMRSMFRDSQATTLDLSSFDVSNVTLFDMSNMFENAIATTGYARTQADADKFNNSSNKPSILTFVDIGDESEIPSYYVQVSSTEFDIDGNYTGTEEYIILPEDKTSGYRITNPNVKGVATSGDYLTDTSSMFQGHTGLSLELFYLNTSNVTDMSYMFEGSQATALNLAGFDTSNVTSMYAMFYYSQATILNVRTFDTSNVTTMSHMFQSSKATSLDLSSFDTSNVNIADMFGMFYNSSARTGWARTQTDADKFNSGNTQRPTGLAFVVKGEEPPLTTYTVTFVDHDDTLIKEELVEEGSSATAPTDPTREGYTFDGWDKAFDVITSDLTVKAIYNINTYTVTFTDDEDVVIGSPQTIEHGSSATAPTPPEKEGYTFVNWDVAFDNVTSNLTVKAIYIEDEVPSGIPAYYVQVSSADFNSNGDYTGTEEYIILPADKTSGYRIQNSNVKGVATSGDYLTDATTLFRGHGGLYLELDYLDTSNVTNMAQMFMSTQATTLDLSNFDTSNVTNMASMFQSSKTTELDLSSFDTSNVTNMYAMFAFSQATTLDLSSFDTSNVTNMSYMFQSSKTTELDLSSFDTSNVTNMSVMFSNSQTTTLDLSSFDTSNVTNMSYMFQSSQATTLDLSSFDTSNVTNMVSMFQSSQATTGYARTTADRNKFNSSSKRPGTLIFVVK